MEVNPVKIEAAQTDNYQGKPRISFFQLCFKQRFKDKF